MMEEVEERKENGDRVMEDEEKERKEGKEGGEKRSTQYPPFKSNFPSSFIQDLSNKSPHQSSTAFHLYTACSSCCSTEMKHRDETQR